MLYSDVLETIFHKRGGGGGYRGGGGARRRAADGRSDRNTTDMLGEGARHGGHFLVAENDNSQPTKDGKYQLFGEKWSRIYHGQLVVRRYFFPSAVCKRINTRQINGIYYRQQDQPSSVGDVKMWGMALFCGWALDIMRGFRSNAGERGFYNVIIDVEGEEKMTGVTTANLQFLLSVLRRQCRRDVVVQEGYPWSREQSSVETW